MQILVDYDNIPDLIRRNGPRYVADRLCAALQRVAIDVLLEDRRLDLRFYGGWYAGRTLSALGQLLAADLQASFPFVLRFNPDNPDSAITVAGALAHSLIIVPKHTLYATFRQRPGLGKVVCADPSTLGCADPICPFRAVVTFFSSNRCSQNTCQVNVSALVSPRGEQKLVDTMLVADLIYLSHSGESTATVVTSDDDVWPGVISAMQLGTRVIHITTKHHERHPPYVAGLPGKFDTTEL
jgi:hypothetical protein